MRFNFTTTVDWWSLSTYFSPGDRSKRTMSSLFDNNMSYTRVFLDETESMYWSDIVFNGVATTTSKNFIHW